MRRGRGGQRKRKAGKLLSVLLEREPELQAVRSAIQQSWPRHCSRMGGRMTCIQADNSDFFLCLIRALAGRQPGARAPLR